MEGYIVLILHLIICGIVWIGIQSGYLRMRKYMFFVALFLPFWGVLLIVVLRFQIGFRKDGVKGVGVEKMKLESALYQSMTVDEKKVADKTVPMEEALLINSSEERRSMILDVLNDNPREYMEFLQKAGDNDDTEVVHYAVTALVEISKENDARLHELEMQYAANPKDREVLENYTSFLWSCLSKNMMQGQVEKMNRELFATLMKEKLSQGGSVSDFVQSITNDLKRGNYTEAAEGLDWMKREFPGEEAYYLLKIQYLAAIKRGEEIRQVLSEIRDHEVYISAKGKEVIAFWEK